MLISKLFTRVLICLILLLSSTIGVKAQNNEVNHDSLAFVRNATGTPKTMLYDEILSALSGEKQNWESGKKVKIALMKTSTETGKIVSKQVFNMSSSQFQRYWLTMVFQGYAISPKFFTSIDDLKNHIRKTPGSIGVLKSVDSDGLDRIEVLLKQD